MPIRWSREQDTYWSSFTRFQITKHEATGLIKEHWSLHDFKERKRYDLPTLRACKAKAEELYGG